MTFTISKKDLIYSIVIAILVITTSASFMAYKVGAQTNQLKPDKLDNKVLAFKEDSKQNIQKEPLEKLYESSGINHEIPFFNCIADLVYTTEPSDTYNPDTPYNLTFFRGSHFSGFQDVNGDNLPDYVLVTGNLNTVGVTGLISTYESCVYLNNGAGWSKAYACHAITETGNSGNAVRKEYRGDCAGTPSAGNN